MQKFGTLDVWTRCFTFNPQNSKIKFKIYSHSTSHKSTRTSDHWFVHLSHVHKVIKRGTNKSTWMLGVYQPYPTFLPLPSFSDNRSFEALYGRHWFSVCLSSCMFQSFSQVWMANTILKLCVVASSTWFLSSRLQSFNFGSRFGYCFISSNKGLDSILVANTEQGILLYLLKSKSKIHSINGIHNKC